MCPEDIFVAALASCINTLFILIAKNSQLGLKSLETIANVKNERGRHGETDCYQRTLLHKSSIRK